MKHKFFIAAIGLFFCCTTNPVSAPDPCKIIVKMGIYDYVSVSNDTIVSDTGFNYRMSPLLVMYGTKDTVLIVKKNTWLAIRFDIGSFVDRGDIFIANKDTTIEHDSFLNFKK